MEKTKRNWLIALIAVAAAVLIAGGVTAGVLVAKGRSAKTVYNSAENGLRRLRNARTRRGIAENL